jgi:hypothetical protein
MPGSEPDDVVYCSVAEVYGKRAAITPSHNQHFDPWPECVPVSVYNWVRPGHMAAGLTSIAARSAGDDLAIVYTLSELSEHAMKRLSLRAEYAMCSILIALVVLAWVGAVAEYAQSLHARAAVSFLVHHHAIGDDPSFIVRTAPNVEVLWISVLRSPFFIGASFLAAIAIGGLSWLIYRLQRISRASRMAVT